MIKWDVCPMILDFQRLRVMPVDITLEAYVCCWFCLNLA